MKVSVKYSTMIVKDLTKSVAFYRDVLGFSEGYYVQLPVGQIQIMESPGGACVELIESPAFPVGLYSVGTDVDDLDETLAQLAAAGYAAEGPAAQTTVGRQAFVKDPNGVRICLIEHTQEYKDRYMR